MILKMWNHLLFVFTEKHPDFGNVYYHEIGVGLRDVFTGSPLPQRYRLDMCEFISHLPTKNHIDNKSVLPFTENKKSYLLVNISLKLNRTYVFTL